MLSFLSDQFCSLVFALSNIYFIGCIYANGNLQDGFNPDWQKCSAATPLWPVVFLLGSGPLFVRLVQSIRRFSDSNHIMHLINVSYLYIYRLSVLTFEHIQGGKYATGIIGYFCFYLWRRQG